jgi:hypothetical protein
MNAAIDGTIGSFIWREGLKLVSFEDWLRKRLHLHPLVPTPAEGCVRCRGLDVGGLAIQLGE